MLIKMIAMKVQQHVLGVWLSSLLLVSPLYAVEYAVHVNVRPNPYQRAMRMVDPLHPTDMEKKHIPRVKVMETADRLLIDAEIPGHPMAEDDYIRGFMIFLDGVVISKEMFTPGNNVPRFYFEMEKKYLTDGQEISIVADCVKEDTSATDFKYHQAVTPNVYILE